MSTANSSPSIADNAHELIRDLYLNPDILPPYNSELMQKCESQIIELFEKYQISLAGLREAASKNVTDNSALLTLVKMRLIAIERIKRCCCAYLMERMNRLRALRWKKGGLITQEVKNNLSPHELNWLNNYNSMIFKYQSEFGQDGINLLNYIETPKETYVDVRAIKDYGEFEMTDGRTVALSKNSIHRLPLQECEIMLRRGILELIGNANAR